jgi:L-asparaginase II
MRENVAGFAGLEPDEIPVAVDGCGVPAFFLPLNRAAFAYARLMGGTIDRYADSTARIVEAMTSFPHYVAGNWSMTTPLLSAFGGDLLAKEGAEGFYAMAVAPGLAAELTGGLRVDDDAVLGIALKIDDGSMDRGRNPVILRLLELLGLDLDTRPELEPYRASTIRNHAGVTVGETRAEFELEIL